MIIFKLLYFTYLLSTHNLLKNLNLNFLKKPTLKHRFKKIMLLHLSLIIVQFFLLLNIIAHI